MQNIPVNKDDFLLLFLGTFWSKLDESLIPIVQDLRPQNKKKFLLDLYDEIEAKRYYPDLPRGYIVSDKHNKVSRIVPVFNHKDSCTYFFCIKQIENFIAVNRVAGTYGGWTLGNLMRVQEDQDVEYLPGADDSPMAINSYNPIKWSDNWKDFQKKAYQYASKGGYKYFLKFDIANFYDTINLGILENKVRFAVDKNQTFVVELLFHFLQNWNRQLERYSKKTVGIPQDEIGDCSRILANFYLQDYDAYMKSECDKHSATYLRYADDQIVMANDKDILYDILFNASKELFKINLNLNSSKVSEFTVDEFITYWAFEIFQKLEDKENRVDINQGVEMYFQWLDGDVDFKRDSVLKRIITVTSKNINILEPHLRYRLLAEMYKPDFVATLNYWGLNHLAYMSESPDTLYKILDEQIESIRFNNFHYIVLKFYKKWRGDTYDFSLLEKRIKELSLVFK